MSADLEMVKTYIKYLKSFCPTPEEREFLEKHKKDILENDYYHALVNESIRKNNYNEEYYKKIYGICGTAGNVYRIDFRIVRTR